MKFWKTQAAVIGEQGRVYGEQMWIVDILCNEDNNINQYRDRFLFYIVFYQPMFSRNTEPIKYL